MANKQVIKSKKQKAVSKKPPFSVSSVKFKKAKIRNVYPEPLLLPPPKKKWMVSEKAGRPRIIATAAELEEKIEEYFNTQIGYFPAKDAEGNIMVKTTNAGTEIIYSRRSPTITGLALFLGFASRQSIYDYMKNNDEFSYIIKRAIGRIEEWAENIILGGGIGGTTATTGAIYWTKCHGWKAIDDSEQEEYTNILKKLAEIEINRKKDNG